MQTTVTPGVHDGRRPGEVRGPSIERDLTGIRYRVSGEQRDCRLGDATSHGCIRQFVDIRVVVLLGSILLALAEAFRNQRGSRASRRRTVSSNSSVSPGRAHSTGEETANGEA